MRMKTLNNDANDYYYYWMFLLLWLLLLLLFINVFHVKMSQQVKIMWITADDVHLCTFSIVRDNLLLVDFDVIKFVFENKKKISSKYLSPKNERRKNCYFCFHLINQRQPTNYHLQFDVNKLIIKMLFNWIQCWNVSKQQ